MPLIPDIETSISEKLKDESFLPQNEITGVADIASIILPYFVEVFTIDFEDWGNILKSFSLVSKYESNVLW